MKPHKHFLVLLTLFCTYHAFAGEKYKMMTDEECTEIRLDKPPSPISKIKIYRTFGIMCVPYTATFIIDSERLIRNNRITHFTSPLYINTQYARLTQNPTIVVYTNLMMPTSINKLKSCDINVLREELFSDPKSALYISKLHEIYKKRSKTELAAAINAAGLSNVIGADEIDKIASTSEFSQFMNDLLQKLCADHSIDLSDMEGMTFADATNLGPGREKIASNLRKILNSNLERGRPTGVNFCDLALADPNINGMRSDGRIDREVCIGSDGKVAGHSTAVVGRRLLPYITKDGAKKFVCQFLLRDVYGSKCFRTMKDGKPADCDEGKYWIDEDTLTHNTMSLFFYKSNNSIEKQKSEK